MLTVYQNRLKRNKFTKLSEWLLVLLLGLIVQNVCLAQTYVASGTMTGTPAAGAYYNNNSIVLTNFTFTATSGSSLQIYISPDCSPFVNNLSSNQNYVLTSTPKISGITTVAGLANQGTCQLSQTVQYFDGLGRPLQTVQLKGSAQGYDEVKPMVYDQLGREAQKYLGYAASSTDGSYKMDAFSTTTGVYNYYNPGGGGTSGAQQSNGVVVNPNPYAQTVFEPSPLNRVIEQGAPGTPWQPVSGSAIGHTVKIIYGSNDATNTTTGTGRWARSYSVSIDPSSGLRSLLDNGANGYTVNTLLVTVTQDENWISGQSNPRLHTTEEYKDINGQIVLKRAFNYTTALQILSTYYVYDDFGELAFVLPPGANPDNGLTSAGNQNTLNNFCYQYNYDQRQRLVSKQLPGKGIEEIVYNLLNKLIYNRDSNDITNNWWKFTKYDVLGRVIMSGVEKSNTSTRTALQSTLTNALTSGTIPEWETISPGAGVQGYTNNSYPNSVNVTPLTVSYYDNYTFQGQPTSVITPSMTSAMTRNLVTATKTAVLNTITNSTPDMLWNVQFYDDLGRITQSYAQHYLGGVIDQRNYDIVTTVYNFENQPLTVIRQHYNTGSTTNAALSVVNNYLYDHVGRNKQTFEQINGGSNILLSQSDYNEIGQVKIKHLHSANGGGQFLQDINYTFNERGWLSSINNPNSVTINTVFGEQLQYNTGATPQYNGNISGLNWQTLVPSGLSLTQQLESYAYTYDPLNRLTLANYTTTGTIGKFNEQVSYDLMGNITALQRTNSTVSGQYLNNFTYDYASGGIGNKLWGIADAGTASQSSNYLYDANGNTIKDSRNQITSISYNLLNLPQTVTRTPGAITYVYAANGNKLRKVSGGLTRDYVAGIEYNNAAIEFVSTVDGRATNSAGVYSYEYYLKDHLGNTRADIQQSGKIAQVQDYYAFGLEFNANNSVTPSPSNQYKYNGKEEQQETGQYDYGARFYDPVIARFTTIDPLAEFARRHSSYEYAFSNPLRFVDPTGMSASDTTYSGGTLKQVNITATKTSSVASTVGNFIVDNLPFVGSGKQLYQGIRDGNWKEATLGAVFLTVDVFTAGEGGEGLKLAEEGAELATAELLKVGAEDEIKEGAEKSLLDIAESDKIDRDLLDAPTKPGDAPKFKSDGKSVEIHHEGQKAEGPFKEMHPDAHRGKGNYSTNHPSGQKPLTAQARKEFNAARRAYWKKEFFKSK